MPPRTPHAGPEVPRGELLPAFDLHLQKLADPNLDLTKISDRAAVDSLKKIEISTSTVRSLTERTRLSGNFDPRRIKSYFDGLYREALKFKGEGESQLAYYASTASLWHERFPPNRRTRIEGLLGNTDLDADRKLEKMLSDGILEFPMGEEQNRYYKIRNGVVQIESGTIRFHLRDIDRALLPTDLQEVYDAFDEIARLDPVAFIWQSKPGQDALNQLFAESGIKRNSNTARTILFVFGSLYAAGSALLIKSPVGTAIGAGLVGLGLLSGKVDPLNGKYDSWASLIKYPEFSGDKGEEAFELLLEDKEIRHLITKYRAEGITDEFFSALNTELGSGQTDHPIVARLRSLHSTRRQVFNDLLEILAMADNDSRKRLIQAWAKERLAPNRSTIFQTAQQLRRPNPDTGFGGFGL